jgi:glycolate oxidase FAD binding subunit
VNSAQQILPLTETVAPADQAAVAEAVRRACEAGTPVYSVGGGTRLDYGVRPTQPGLGLSLAGLGRVVDYPARDLTITVEAGVTIAELASRLASEGQRLPVDVPQADRATVGGAVATNPSGPRRFQFGTLRDYVIGARAVDGQGTEFSAGGRVVKNAAGYNLCRLLTGSLGTIGVITQVTLMVKPLAEASAFLACDLADFETAERLLAALVHTDTLPAAVELLAGPAWQDDESLVAESGSAAGRLVVGFEGTSAEVDWMLERLEEEWRPISGVPATAIQGDACVRVWSRLTEFPAETSGNGRPAQAVIQLSVLPSATVGFVERLREVDPECSIQAHAGDGVIRARLSAAPDQVAGVLDGRLRQAVATAGGSMVVLSRLAETELSPNQIWGPSPDGLAVMQSIKSRFDPKGILNPGRFIYENR